MLLEGRGHGNLASDWEHYPFVLCRHIELRKTIFAHRDDADDKHGKYVSPADLRSSPGFDRLLREVADHRQADPSKAHFRMSAEQRKAEEVVRRLVLFNALCGRSITRLYKSTLVGQKLVKAAVDQLSAQSLDPIHIAAIDLAAGSAWLSLSQLRQIAADEKVWATYLEARIAANPQTYWDDDTRAALEEFQQQIKSGRGSEALEDLAFELQRRHKLTIEQFRDAHAREDFATANKILNQAVRSAPEELADHARRAFANPASHPEDALRQATRYLRTILTSVAEKSVQRIGHGLALAQSGYDADDPKFRMFHLEYLESRFPNVYQTALERHSVPKKRITEILDQFANVRDAFVANDAANFGTESARFFEKLSAGDDVQSSVPIELTYNRVQPFLWSWIVMLLATIALVTSTMTKPSVVYVAGLLLYGVSLVFQIGGFVARIYISGRAPVGNMYETVIWAALMSAIFALVLELIYRRRVIALAGAIVATLGLILADQLPLALDPRIGQLAPVLRTNYWLTVHVITIVSSYAAGTLAWGLGNITLGILAFGHGDRETVKQLSNFTYRAMQITVFLLATGTFLGGWWAAESWGRFWGWDPKEVGALIALICYVIPLHARYIGWVKDFGLAMSAVLCYASIIVSWYVVNFVFASGLHSYGFGGASGMLWVLWATLLNVEWLLICLAVKSRSTGCQPVEA